MRILKCIIWILSTQTNLHNKRTRFVFYVFLLMLWNMYIRSTVSSELQRIFNIYLVSECINMMTMLRTHQQCTHVLIMCFERSLNLHACCPSLHKCKSHKHTTVRTSCFVGHVKQKQPKQPPHNQYMPINV